jgi:hypothetical protein
MAPASNSNRNFISNSQKSQKSKLFDIELSSYRLVISSIKDKFLQRGDTNQKALWTTKHRIQNIRTYLFFVRIQNSETSNKLNDQKFTQTEFPNKYHDQCFTQIFERQQTRLERRETTGASFLHANRFLTYICKLFHFGEKPIVRVANASIPIHSIFSNATRSITIIYKKFNLQNFCPAK